jgi:hypothetical protein
VANFDPWGVAEKEEKRKKRRKKKEKKEKKDLPNNTCHSKLFFLECLLDEAWTIFEAIHRQFYENEPPHQSQKTSTKLYWMDHLTTIMLSILANILDLKLPRFSSKYNEYKR